MPYSQTSTSLGALSSVTSGSWIPMPSSAQAGVVGPIVKVVATSVTTGATIAVEGRNLTAAGAGSARELHTAVIAADGTYVYPLKDLANGQPLPDQIRMTVISRTDGTYTNTVLTKAT